MGYFSSSLLGSSLPVSSIPATPQCINTCGLEYTRFTQDPRLANKVNALITQYNAILQARYALVEYWGKTSSLEPEYTSLLGEVEAELTYYLQENGLTFARTLDGYVYLVDQVRA